MISAETIAELEARGIDYILGARERSTTEIREVVLTDRALMVPLTIPRARGSELDIAVKEVIAGDWGPGTKPRRYVVCFNPAEARRDAAGRETILASLRSTLKAGEKELVGNAGIGGSSPARGRGISRSMRRESPMMPGSTDCMCCAPTAA